MARTKTLVHPPLPIQQHDWITTGDLQQCIRCNLPQVNRRAHRDPDAPRQLDPRELAAGERAAAAA